MSGRYVGRAPVYFESDIVGHTNLRDGRFYPVKETESWLGRYAGTLFKTSESLHRAISAAAELD